MVLIVTIVISPFIFIEFIYSHRRSQHVIMGEIIDLSDTSIEPLSMELVIYFLYKFVVTTVSVTLPLPVGLFTPTFLTGGVLGKIFGQVVNAYPNLTSIPPSQYALIG